MWYEMFASVFESFLFVFFLVKFLGWKRQSKWNLPAAFLTGSLLCANILYADRIAVFVGFSILVDIVITFLFYYLCLSGTLWVYFRGFCTYYLGLFLCAYLSFGILEKLQILGLDALCTYNGNNRQILILTAKGLNVLYVAVILFLTRRLKKHNKKNIDLGFGIIPAAVFSVTYLFHKNMMDLYLKAPQISPMIITAVFGILFLTLIIFYLSMRNIRQADKERENVLLKKTIQTEKDSLARYIRQEREKFRFAHDLKHKMFAVSYLMENQQMEEAAEKMREIISELGGTAKDFTVVQSILHTIAENEIREAKERGVSLQSDIQVTDQLEVELTDICVLVGNLLDNAVEAAEKSEDRQVKLQVCEKYGCIKIKVANSFAGDAEEVQKMISRKRDQKRHGFGVESVKRVVQSYHGQYWNEIKEGQFISTVIFDLCQK